MAKKDNREFYVHIEISNMDTESIPGHEKTRPWIDFCVFEKHFNKFLFWRYNAGDPHVRGRYQIPADDINIEGWIKALARKKDTILEFTSKLDLDTFIRDNEIDRYAVISTTEE